MSEHREARRHITDAIKQLIDARTRQREALAAVLYHEYRLRQMLGVWEESEEMAIPDPEGGYYIYDPWPQGQDPYPMQGALRHTREMVPVYPETTDETEADSAH
jgi:hypothetical protein